MNRNIKLPEMRNAKMRNGPSEKVTLSKILKREDKLKKVDETILI